MQIIERSIAGVRSAVYRLRKEGCALEFVLFPMIHAGEREFYEEVGRRLQSCDFILAEGVNSKHAWLLTLSYRIIRYVRRIDLVTQQEALSLSSLSDRIINTDMDGATFDRRWSALPLSVRLLLASVLPFYVAWIFLFGTREALAESAAIDDMPSRDEILNHDEIFEKLRALLVDERDQVLIENVRSLLKSGRAGTAGIVYGAAHMRNLLDFLFCENYQIVEAEWVRVFDL